MRDGGDRQRAEHVDEGDGPAVRTDREDVGDLADQAGVPPAYHPVVDDGAAQALAQVQVGEVVQLRDAGVAFGSRRPVDVVVDHHRTVDEPGQHVRRGQFAEQERGVG